MILTVRIGNLAFGYDGHRIEIVVCSGLSIGKLRAIYRKKRAAKQVAQAQL